MRWVWPRYVRPVHGPLLALHSASNGRHLCDALNEHQKYIRLLLQASPKAAVVTPLDRVSCFAALPRDSRASIAERLCGMLSEKPQVAGAASYRGLAEPLPRFWQWMREHRLTTDSTTSTATKVRSAPLPR